VTRELRTLRELVIGEKSAFGAKDIYCCMILVLSSKGHEALSSSSTLAPRHTDLIMSPNPADVFWGRRTGPSQLVAWKSSAVLMYGLKEHKHEYNLESSEGKRIGNLKNGYKQVL
jgi:hypothetical protein